MKYVKMMLLLALLLASGIFTISEIKERNDRDSSIPVITSDREILEIPCDYTRGQLMEGLNAYDEKDGDLTSDIVVGSISRFLEKGVCDVNYVVFDSANQPFSLTRKLKFTDYHSPQFILTEPLIFEEGEGSYQKTVERIGAVDQLDGDLKEWIRQIDTDASYQKEGTYHIAMEVSNSFGDTVSVNLPIHVVRSGVQNLDIRLSSAICYIGIGETIDPQAMLDGVYDSDENALDPEIVTAVSNVNAQEAGCYEIEYQANDGQGNIGEAWLVVVVQE